MSDPRILSEGDYTDHFETKYRGALIEVAALKQQLADEKAKRLEDIADGRKLWYLVVEMGDASDLVMDARSAMLSDPTKDHLLAIELANLRALVRRTREITGGAE